MTQNKHVCTICCRPEVAGDVISSGNVKTIEGYAAFKFEAACISNFLDIKTRMATDWWGSAKRDVTHPTSNVVYNACYHSFRKRSRVAVYRLAVANLPRQQYDTSRLCKA